MAGMLMQERILGFALGFAGGLGALIYQQKHLWRSTGSVADVYSGGKLPPPKIYVPEPIFGRRAQEELIHAWNVGVDQTLGKVVTALSIRGWDGTMTFPDPIESCKDIVAEDSTNI